MASSSKVIGYIGGRSTTGRSIDFLTLPSSDRQTVRRIDRRLDCASEELQSGPSSQTQGFEENLDSSVDSGSRA